MNNTKEVIDQAKFAVGLSWMAEKDVSTATIQAREISQWWQDKMIQLHPERYQKDVPVGGKLKERIELVDFLDNVAYELKVSGNNPDHEFFKDLFKALTFNQHHNVTKLKRLVFITEAKGIDELENGLGKVAANFLQLHKITVEFAKL